MQKDTYIEKLLNDFVFLDSRLGDHPKVRAGVLWVQGAKLILAECAPVSTRTNSFEVSLEHTLGGSVLKHQKHLVIQDMRTNEADSGPFDRVSASDTFVVALPSVISELAVPLIDGSDAIGVLSFESFEKLHFEEKHVGLAQLLAALLSYARRHSNSRHITPASISLGKALKNVREEVGLTLAEVAARIKQGRIPVSRWESGAQPPSRNVLYEWCRALGLFSSRTGSLVTLVDVTPRVLKMLKEDPGRLRELSPSQFEQFIAERLDRMGFEVTLTGDTSHRDGGIDFVAVPKLRNLGAFLLAGQVKHHRENQKTGRDAVDRLLAWKDSPFRLGLLVTNTSFTKDAKWVAEQVTNSSFIRLRDFDALKRWLAENFWSQEDWQEIPDEVSLAPGVTVRIPKPHLSSHNEIWPGADFYLKNG